jgi:hypothetical protein
MLKHQNKQTMRELAMKVISFGLVLAVTTFGHPVHAQSTGMLMRGPQAGPTAWTDYLLERRPGDLARLLYTAGAQGRRSGIYEHNVSSYFGISTHIERSDDPPDWDGVRNGTAPSSAFTALITNAGSAKDAVGNLTLAHCTVPRTACFGANHIALTTAPDGSVKLVGLEIDVMWPEGTRVPDSGGSGGLMINMFNTNHGGNAIQLGAMGPGATWDNGLAISGVSGAGVFVEGGATSAPDALLNSNLVDGLKFGTAAVRIGYDDGVNRQRLLFDGAHGVPATLALDRNDSLNISSPKRLSLSSGSVERFTLDAQGVVFIANSNGPPTTTPSGGGYLYVEQGVLKYRGPTGKVTTLADR